MDLSLICLWRAFTILGTCEWSRDRGLVGRGGEDKGKGGGGKGGRGRGQRGKGEGANGKGEGGRGKGEGGRGKGEGGRGKGEGVKVTEGAESTQSKTQL